MGNLISRLLVSDGLFVEIIDLPIEVDDDFPGPEGELHMLYWNGHNLFVHQLLGLYLCVRVSSSRRT